MYVTRRGPPFAGKNIQKQVERCRCHCFSISAADRFSASALGAHTCKKCINPPSKYDAVQISSVVVVECACFLSVKLPLLRKQVSASIFDAQGQKRRQGTPKKDDFDFEPHACRVIGFYVCGFISRRAASNWPSLCKSADPKSKRCRREHNGPLFQPSFLCCWLSSSRLDRPRARIRTRQSRRQEVWSVSSLGLNAAAETSANEHVCVCCQVAWKLASEFLRDVEVLPAAF